MKKTFLIKILLCFIVVVCACKKQYNPPTINSNINLLVVEGIINSGGDTTFIKLSRTVNIGSRTSRNPEMLAAITVEDDQNTIINLKDMGNGTYFYPSLNIDNTRQYRLRVKTADNRAYLSDFVPVQITPPIDSVGFKVTDEGLQIYANTHDASNNVQYYRWDYTEEWMFHAYAESDYIGAGSFPAPDSIVMRVASNEIYTCFKGDSSSDVVINSTAGLKQSVLYQSPITTVLKSSEKVELEYSILINQYALTPGAYNFYKGLKGTTEELGSIFDSQPSKAPGNIHCLTNPSEAVIGYVSVNNVTQSKRIFIHKYNQLPTSWIAQYPYDCLIQPIYYADETSYEGFKINLVIYDLLVQPYKAIAIDPIGTVGWDITTFECGDCTVRGSRTPPPYWVY